MLYNEKKILYLGGQNMYYTVKETAKILGVTETEVLKLCATKELETEVFVNAKDESVPIISEYYIEKYTRNIKETESENICGMSPEDIPKQDTNKEPMEELKEVFDVLNDINTLLDIANKY
jgi:hypothetical protein